MKLFIKSFERGHLFEKRRHPKTFIMFINGLFSIPGLQTSEPTGPWSTPACQPSHRNPGSPRKVTDMAPACPSAGKDGWH
ncbi:hypothetical protein NJLHNGOC_10530 [Novacetimonas cocois]|uniref:Uncharacterized protein n=1 Tax=Novacetimonas cocois TaxID=1747507 RepID=A0A365YTI9_9PROT|nr:hypothetical protein NJLHNGOC_10530 [Novacetimonas cocois]